MDCYKLLCNVLEARYSHPGAKRLRDEIGQLSAQLASESDPGKRSFLKKQIKAKQNRIALMPNLSYSQYRDI